jgi:hypothetical protein
MTVSEAKAYASHHLPCTASHVVQLFHDYFKGHLLLMHLTGFKPDSLGFRTLVFDVSISPWNPNSPNGVTPYGMVSLFDAWCEYHGLKLMNVGDIKDGNETRRCFWVETKVSVKEDRRIL